MRIGEEPWPPKGFTASPAVTNFIRSGDRARDLDRLQRAMAWQWSSYTSVQHTATSVVWMGDPHGFVEEPWSEDTPAGRADALVRLFEKITKGTR
jgi:hypothetical protein